MVAKCINCALVCHVIFKKKKIKILCGQWKSSKAKTLKHSKVKLEFFKQIHKKLHQIFTLDALKSQTLDMFSCNSLRQMAYTGSRQPKAKKCSFWDTVSQSRHKATQPEMEIDSEVGLAHKLSDNWYKKGVLLRWNYVRRHKQRTSQSTHTVSMGLHNLFKKMHFQNLLNDDTSIILYRFYFMEYAFCLVWCEI